MLGNSSYVDVDHLDDQLFDDQLSDNQHFAELHFDELHFDVNLEVAKTSLDVTVRKILITEWYEKIMVPILE